MTDFEQIHADLEHIIELLNTLVGLIALQEGSTAAALAAPNTADNPYGPS